MMAVSVRQLVLLLMLPISVLCPPAMAQGVADQATVEALKKYILEKDRPEVFGETQYRMRIDNILDVDVDNDGKRELVVHTFPHYRQSATVLIYMVSAESGITRVTEGLAPGPLQQISGEYLDSHEIGEGVDLALGEDQGQAGSTEKFVAIALEHFGGVVAYRNFCHADGRKGPGYYIDMRNVELPKQEDNCGSFEFSKVRQIAAGHVREDAPKNYLAAWVGDEIYVYLIRGISSQGMLDKRTWIVKAPTDFKGFIPEEGLAYKTASGTALLTLTD